MNRKPRILVVDDQEGILRMLTLILDHAGYEVITAVDGKTAIDKSAVCNPDVIILDIMMPEINGIETCRRFRAQPVTATTPILMLSAKNQVADKISAFEAGADDYVIKNVAREELLARIKVLLHRSRQKIQRAPGRVISILGAKGGVGTTSVAINVGAYLAQNHKATLIELRAFSGTAANQLQMTPSRDIGTLLSLGDKLNAQAINRSIVFHNSKLGLLAAPTLTTYDCFPEEFVPAVLSALNNNNDYLIFDLFTVTTKASRQVLEQSDLIILVTEPEPLAMMAAQNHLQVLKKWGLFDQIRGVLLSRSPSANLLSRSEVEQQLFGGNSGQNGRGNVSSMTRKIIGMIPPSPEIFQQATRLGNPVVTSARGLVPAQALSEVSQWVMKHLPIAEFA